VERSDTHQILSTDESKVTLMGVHRCSPSSDYLNFFGSQAEPSAPIIRAEPQKSKLVYFEDSHHGSLYVPQASDFLTRQIMHEPFWQKRNPNLVTRRDNCAMRIDRFKHFFDPRIANKNTGR
jgi:hypothetical protein